MKQPLYLTAGLLCAISIAGAQTPGSYSRIAGAETAVRRDKPCARAADRCPGAKIEKKREVRGDFKEAQYRQ